MRRRTETITMDNSLDAGLGVQGIRVLNWTVPQKPVAGRYPCMPGSDRALDDQCVEPPIMGVWRPHIHSISMAAKEGNALAAEPITDGEFQASLLPYNLYDGFRNAGLAKTVEAGLYKQETERQDLVGFRIGDTARRVVYGSNSGQGYTVPRQFIPGVNECMETGFYWVLVLYWNFADPGPAVRRAAWVIDHELRFGEA